MRIKHGLLAMVGILAIAGTTRAESVTINLGTTSQNLVETGIGDNGFGQAQWYIQQGTCSVAGGDTTCVFSGTYTGTTTGYTSGTYSLVSTYVGTGPTYTGAGDPFPNGPTPLIGISETPGSSYFNFEYLPTTATINLDLDDTVYGSSVIPVYNSTGFVNGYNIADVGTPVCTGGTACDPFDVGEKSGATFTDTVDGQATFTVAGPPPPPPGVPEPSSLALLGAGLLGMLGLSLRRLF